MFTIPCIIWALVLICGLEILVSRALRGLHRPSHDPQAISTNGLFDRLLDAHRAQDRQKTADLTSLLIWALGKGYPRPSALRNHPSPITGLEAFQHKGI